MDLKQAGSAGLWWDVTAHSVLTHYVHFLANMPHAVIFIVSKTSQRDLGSHRSWPPFITVQGGSASYKTDSLALKKSYTKQTPFIKPAANTIHHPWSLDAKCLLLVRKDKLLCRAIRTPDKLRDCSKTQFKSALKVHRPAENAPVKMHFSHIAVPNATFIVLL